MNSKRTRLDRFLVRQAGIRPAEVRPMLARGRVLVDGEVATGISQPIGQFTRVQLDGQVLQDVQAVYIMLHKPVGVVSATRDARHRTAIDLLDRPDRASLHIAGRLDYNSSGLLLLTNDGRWSRALSEPANNIRKWYRVTLEQEISADCIQAFARGMYFPYEGITTRPAELRVTGSRSAEVALVEGRYHQVRRMFGRFRNRVLSLHRIAVGKLPLDPALAAGEHRELTAREVAATWPGAGRPGSPPAGSGQQLPPAAVISQTASAPADSVTV